MISGIYKLTFRSGYFYIGKSNNIERRWKDHFTKFQKGTAAKSMQDEFNNFGGPIAKVIFECHEDHIDLMEAYFINLYKSDKMLNATYPTPPDAEDTEVFEKWGNQVLQYSTANHIRHIIKQAREIENLKDALESLENEFDVIGKEYTNSIAEIKSGTALVKAEIELKECRRNLKIAQDLAIARLDEINRLKRRNWFQRLFNM